jgi:hypothetical protein
MTFGLIGLLLVIALGVGGYFALPLLARKDNGQGTTTGTDNNLGRFGGVEIGSTGVKAIVLDFIRGDDGLPDFIAAWKPKEINVSLGKLPADGLKFDPNAVTDAREAVKTFMAQMDEKYGLKKDKIFVVASSGVFSGFKTKEAAAEAKNTLTNEMKDVCTGLDCISVTDEAKYDIEASVPAKVRGETLLLDFGSGNIKGGFFEDGAFTNMSVDYGTKTFLAAVTKEAKKSKAPLPQLAEEVCDQLVVPKLKEELDRKPSLNRPPRVVVLGGAVWAMATFTRPEAVGKSRIDLSPGDVGRFRALVRGCWAPPGEKDKATVEREMKEKILASITEREAREKAEKAVNDVQKVFSPDQLVSAAELLRGVAAEYQFGTKQLLFRNAAQAWLVGYLMKKGGVTQ